MANVREAQSRGDRTAQGVGGRDEEDRHEPRRRSPAAPTRRPTGPRSAHSLRTGSPGGEAAGCWSAFPPRAVPKERPPAPMTTTWGSAAGIRLGRPLLHEARSPARGKRGQAQTGEYDGRQRDSGARGPCRSATGADLRDRGGVDLERSGSRVSRRRVGATDPPRSEPGRVGAGQRQDPTSSEGRAPDQPHGRAERGSASPPGYDQAGMPRDPQSQAKLPPRRAGLPRAFRHSADVKRGRVLPPSAHGSAPEPGTSPANRNRPSGRLTHPPPATDAQEDETDHPGAPGSPV